MKQLFALKECSCGEFHIFLPKKFKTSDEDGLTYFICDKCNSTITIRTKFILDQYLDNLALQRHFNGEYLGSMKE
jgi:hypothetical protein